MKFITWHKAPFKVQIHPVFMEDTQKQNMYSYVKFYKIDNEVHKNSLSSAIRGLKGG